MPSLLQIRGGTAAQWTAANPILRAREPGLEIDTGKIKWGDGVTHWSSLAYWPGGPAGAAGANGGSEIAAQPLSTSYGMTVAWATIPSWQVVVPANSGPVEVGVPDGLLVQVNTGTNGANTTFEPQLRIVDELGAQLVMREYAIKSSAASQVWRGTIPLSAPFIANNVISKTYKVQAQMTNVGTNGATASVFANDLISGATPTLRAIHR